MSNISFPCIIPTLPKDYKETGDHLYDLFEMLSISKLIFIGPKELEELVKKDASNLNKLDRIEFINENDILPFDVIKSAYENRLSEIALKTGQPERISRTGWYYQQFIKMEYHKLCEGDYYLCWDADTIPLKHIEMFHSSGQPYLDIKTEHINSYFDTLKNLFGYGKVIKESFISEHMLFNKSFMSEMINDILKTDMKGNTFYEKIFSAVEQPFNGFSEFETYGSWIAHKHPDKYKLRHWKSLRNTNFMIDRKDLNEDDIKWLATGFDAASFERYQEVEPELSALFRNPYYREKISADIFYNELLTAGLFGEYQHGGILKDGNIYPV